MTADTPHPANAVDARGLLCPLPIARTARALHNAPPGTEVELLADDPNIEQDLPGWCRAMGHELVTMTEQGGVWRCRVRRGAVKRGGNAES